MSAILYTEKYEFLISGEAEGQVNAFISEEHSLNEYKTVSHTFCSCHC